MKDAKHIRIAEPQILRNRCLISRISFSNDFKNFFHSQFFYFLYDVNISNVPISILQIPIVSNILPVACAVGGDIYIKELDSNFLDSIKKIIQMWSKWWHFKPITIHVERIVSNKTSNNNYGLTFSGGLDSTASYIRHKNKNPNLIMIWGADIPVNEKEFWINVKNQYKKFAAQENTDINFIKSNLRDIINEDSINIIYGRGLDSNWWVSIQHGIGTAGLCAPLTVVKSIKTLLFAAAVTPDHKIPTASHIFMENDISWADTTIFYDSFDLSRHEKVKKLIKPFVQETQQYPTLRVCYHQFQRFNCSKCEKCWRTITSLVLENIDPNECGFNIDTQFFQTLKEKLIYNSKKFIKRENTVFMWDEIKKFIPAEISHNLYNSKRFFEWFKDFNLIFHETPLPSFIWILGFIYLKFPKSIQTLLKKLEPYIKSINLF